MTGAGPGTGARAARSHRQMVHRTLRERILTLELAPGAALSENDLAAQLGTSRTPVRESLILLSEEGLVHVFPQVGSFVSRVDRGRVNAAQFVREAVELAALDDLPVDLDPQVLGELRANLDRQYAVGPDVRRFFELDEEFHAGLLRLSGHADAWSTVVAAKRHLDRARRLGLRQAESSTRWADQHAAILRAVTAGDIGVARTTLRRHLRTVLDDIDRIGQRSPELFAPSSD